MRSAFRFFSILWLLLSALVVRAQKPEDFVAQHATNLYRERAQRAAGDVTKLQELWGESEERVRILRRQQRGERSFNAAMLSFFERELLPRLDADLRARGVDPSPAAWIARQKESARRLEEASRAFRIQVDEILKRRPALRRVLAYAAFSRSETLSDGTIGDWNPNSASEIQRSALDGLDSVLDEIEAGALRQQRLNVEMLQRFQGRLLGAAEHHYSQAGRINEIYFKNPQGAKVHVREYLKALENHIASVPASAAEAFYAYDEFLNLHPFGDSNGRIAELIKQLVLDRAGLPPLLTAEKTALEGFLPQTIFGQGDVDERILREIEETSAYLEAWDRVLADAGSIVHVDLQGTTVVVRARKENQVRSFFAVRSHTLPDGLSAPIKGTPVLVDRPGSNLKMRITGDAWRSAQDLGTSASVELKRDGPVRTSFELFSGPSRLVRDGDALEETLAYYYQHPNGSLVWFNNQGRNYSSGYRAPSACARAVGALVP